MMLIPAGIGYWLDDVWGTSPWVLIVGVVLGMCIGMKQLLDIARVDSDGKPKE
jgi:F0F1-type ATP synthase assembly protein I